MKKLDLQIGNYSLAAFVDGNDANSMVAVKPLCVALGIDPKRQVSKLQNNPQFSWRLMSSTGFDGKRYEMLCISLKEVCMWLCGINANRVKPETREKLVVFQKELQWVIYEAVRGSIPAEIMQKFQETIEEVRSIKRDNENLRQQVKDLQEQNEVILENQSNLEGHRRVQGEHIELYRAHVASEAGRSLALQKRLQH